MVSRYYFFQKSGLALQEKPYGPQGIQSRGEEGGEGFMNYVIVGLFQRVAALCAYFSILPNRVIFNILSELSSLKHRILSQWSPNRSFNCLSLENDLSQVFWVDESH